MYFIIRKITDMTYFYYIAEQMLDDKYPRLNNLHVFLNAYMIYPEFIEIVKMAIEKYQIIKIIKVE